MQILVKLTKLLLRTLKVISEAPQDALTEKYVLKGFTELTGKHLRQSLILIVGDFIKKETPPEIFSVNFAKFFRQYLFTEHQSTASVVFIAKVFHCTKNHIS